MAVTATQRASVQTVNLNKKNYLKTRFKGPFVTCTDLLNKLITIERSIGVVHNSTLRDMVEDAQDCVLEMQKETAEGFLAEAWREAMIWPDWLRKAS